jgi:hypothetical protein
VSASYGANGKDDGDDSRKVRIAIDTVEKKARRRLALVVSACGAVTALLSLVAFGYRGGRSQTKALDAKADLADVAVLQKDVAAIQAHQDDEREWRENFDEKLDEVLRRLARIDATNTRRNR